MDLWLIERYTNSYWKLIGTFTHIFNIFLKVSLYNQTHLWVATKRLSMVSSLLWTLQRARNGNRITITFLLRTMFQSTKCGGKKHSYSSISPERGHLQLCRLNKRLKKLLSQIKKYPLVMNKVQKKLDKWKDRKMMNNRRIPVYQRKRTRMMWKWSMMSRCRNNKLSPQGNQYHHKPHHLL